MNAEEPQVIDYHGLPYELKPGLTLAGMRLKAEFGKRGWRCKLGWHKREIVATYDPMKLVEGLDDPIVIGAAAGLAPLLGPLVQCERCGEMAEKSR